MITSAPATAIWWIATVKSYDADSNTLSVMNATGSKLLSGVANFTRVAVTAGDTVLMAISITGSNVAIAVSKQP
jgi:hypothetical protein